MDQLVAPIWLSQSDPHPTYVVNVFIQLLEPTRRAPAVIANAKEEEEQKAEIAKRPQKHPSKGQSSGHNGKWTENIAAQVTSAAANAATTTAIAAAIKRSRPPFE